MIRSKIGIPSQVSQKIFGHKTVVPVRLGLSGNLFDIRLRDDQEYELVGVLKKLGCRIPDKLPDRYAPLLGSIVDGHQMVSLIKISGGRLYLKYEISDSWVPADQPLSVIKGKYIHKVQDLEALVRLDKKNVAPGEKDKDFLYNLTDADESLVALILKGNSGLYRYLSQELRDHKRTALCAVRLDGTLLKYTSQRLRSDRDIVLLTISKAPHIIQTIDPRFHDDLEIMLIACEFNHGFFDLASDRLKSDKELVMEAMHQSMYYAPDVLRKSPAWANDPKMKQIAEHAREESFELFDMAMLPAFGVRDFQYIGKPYILRGGVHGRKHLSTQIQC